MWVTHLEAHGFTVETELVTGDIINGGGMVSIEAPVGGRIRGQREFTTVRPGSQDV